MSSIEEGFIPDFMSDQKGREVVRQIIIQKSNYDHRSGEKMVIHCDGFDLIPTDDCDAISLWGECVLFIEKMLLRFISCVKFLIRGL